MTTEDEWLHGWDATPGIVSVWADTGGSVSVWRRDPETRALSREEGRFQPWILLDSLLHLEHLGERLRPHGPDAAPGCITYQELDGEGALRFMVRGADSRTLRDAVLYGARQRLGRALNNVRELGSDAVTDSDPGATTPGEDLAPHEIDSDVPSVVTAAPDPATDSTETS